MALVPTSSRFGVTRIPCYCDWNLGLSLGEGILNICNKLTLAAVVYVAAFAPCEAESASILSVTINNGVDLKLSCGAGTLVSVTVRGLAPGTGSTGMTLQGIFGEVPGPNPNLLSPFDFEVVGNNLGFFVQELDIPVQCTAACLIKFGNIISAPFSTGNTAPSGSRFYATASLRDGTGEVWGPKPDGIKITCTPVPEPTTMVLMGLALAAGLRRAARPLKPAG